MDAEGKRTAVALPSGKGRIGNPTHEVMAISGHRTLSETQRYTDAADRQRLAESGMAKRRESENALVTNLDPARNYKLKR